MSDAATYPVLSVVKTTGSKIDSLPIKDAQMTFVSDKHWIAFDYNGKRTFYKQIEILDTEEERLSLLAPISGLFYFVLEKATLWTYSNDWIKVAEPLDNIITTSDRVVHGDADELLSDILDKYILNIDYTLLKFNTTEIVIETMIDNKTSAVLGEAILGQMILA